MRVLGPAGLLWLIPPNQPCQLKLFGLGVKRFLHDFSQLTVSQDDKSTLKLILLYIQVGC
jgi:hypothetical protein